jgi:hypothetical protein
MKILKLDHTGHTSIDTNIETEFKRLMSQGYAMFLNDEQIKELPVGQETGEILALAPLVGG